MKLMVIDGNSIVNRAYYGIRPLSTRDGLYTHAVYGFLTILQKLLDEEAPEALCVAFDLKAPTFRHQEFDGYKAKRKEMPEELAVQMPVLKEVLDAMRIPRYELEGYEADDLIGTISVLCQNAGWDCVIVTGDKDSLQLITDHVRVRLVSTRMGQTLAKDMTAAAFGEEYGFPPEGMVDLKGLMGDPSDNIPGVAGVGEKTALDLVRRCGSIDALYDKIDELELKPALRKKLLEGREQAEMSRRLAAICTDAPFPFAPEEALRQEPDKKALYPLFLRLEFSRLIERYGLSPEAAEPAGAGEEEPAVTILKTGNETEDQLRRWETAPRVAVCWHPGLDALAVCDGETTALALQNRLGEAYLPFLKALFGGGVKIIAHEVKELTGRLLAEGLPAEGFVFDTALAAYLLGPTEGGYALERLSVSYLNAQLPAASLWQAADAFSPLGGGDDALKAFSAYAQGIYTLWAVLEPRLAELGMMPLFQTVELPLCRVLAEMERTGIRVDRSELQQFGKALSVGIAEAEGKIFSMAGAEFNINSPKQLGEILFDKMNLPPVKKTKTGYSTNADVLDKLRGQHPIISDILEYRQLTKLKSTYVDGLSKVIAPDGRIHTSFQMTVTATGRLSSVEPNLQNIPVRTKLGSEMRKMFLAGEGNVLVDADYSQIELRILAHIADDKTMQEAFRAGVDIHTVTASQVFGVPLERVTHAMRSSAKAVNFGMVYGISDFSLAQDIGVTRAEARRYMEQYFETYAGVRAYMKEIVERARRDGCVTTLMNRRRYLPELASSNFNTRSFGERVALNMPIQGTAADIIKLAMVRVHGRLQKEIPQAHLVLQVHDELLVECPREDAEAVKALLKEEMEGVMSLSAPLVAEATAGETWYAAKG